MRQLLSLSQRVCARVPTSSFAFISATLEPRSKSVTNARSCLRSLSERRKFSLFPECSHVNWSPSYITSMRTMQLGGTLNPLNPNDFGSGKPGPRNSPFRVLMLQLRFTLPSVPNVHTPRVAERIWLHTARNRKRSSGQSGVLHTFSWRSSYSEWTATRKSGGRNSTLSRASLPVKKTRSATKI